MFGRLMPREGRFFDLFNRHAEQIVLGGRELVALFAAPAAEANGRVQKIDTIETAADRITHETVALLHKTFITPLDRDVVHQLISAMDDVLDGIQDVAESLSLYNVRTVTDEARQLSSLCLSCCERVKTVVGLIEDMDDAAAIMQTCREIDQLETDADRVMRTAMSRLFRDERDPMQVIKLKAIYELLEAITDRCEDVAKIIEGIVLENS